MPVFQISFEENGCHSEAKYVLLAKCVEQHFNKQNQKAGKFNKNIHSSFRSLNPKKLKCNVFSCLQRTIQTSGKPLALAREELDEEIVVHQKFVMSSYSPETILNRHKYFTSKFEEEELNIRFFSGSFK